MSGAQIATWTIVALGTAGVIVRPWRLPEAIWAVAGAIALVVLGLLPLAETWIAVAKGADVYFFLTGMMLIAELARSEGLFDWLAGIAAAHARGSAKRLFALIYIVGIVVTTFLSNDATAVVLTPAVYAAARAARAAPLPYLYVCAFIANAASFVLPISNPANLVVFGSDMPPLLRWLARFGLPSIVSIVVTYVVLRWTQRLHLREPTEEDPHVPSLERGGVVVAVALVIAAVLLLIVSAAGLDLGFPTFIAGVATLLIVLLLRGYRTVAVVRHVSWGVLPLVAGLFIFVEALNRTGVLKFLSDRLRAGSHEAPALTAWIAGGITAFAGNIANNLPVGLLSGAAIHMDSPPPLVTDAILIGVDLGPNLSVTGSLATILWLVALRREGEDVSALEFLRLGALIMPVSLVLALAALFVGR
ncbi:MAG: arsenic transporter [Methylobacteriaceae bacterium]|nr:arsenic transporter [Methylobacteriaceae bacterium]